MPMRFEQLAPHIERLPEEIQQQLLDYITFLLTKYEQPVPAELSPEGKAFIEARLQQLNDHPEQRRDWSEVRTRLYRRKGWEG